jgi:hypothetical protein
MANDRLWLRCRCGAIKLLAKYWVSKCELWDPINIDAWLTEHALSCGAEAGFFRDDAFTLHTEATLPPTKPTQEQLDQVRDGIEDGLVKGGVPRKWAEIAVGKDGPSFDLKAKRPPCPYCGGMLSVETDPQIAAVDEIEFIARCDACGQLIPIVLKLGE